MLTLDTMIKKRGRFRLGPITANFEPGAIYGLFGLNGQGKTTLIDLIMKLIIPDEGTIVYDGEEDYRARCAYISGENLFDPNLKLHRIKDLYAAVYDEWDETCYQYYCNAYNIDESQRLKDISAGSMQRFLVALGLSHNADLYLFDEPTTGIDPFIREEIIDDMRDEIYARNATAILSTHNVKELEHVIDYVMVLHNGKLIINSDRLSFAEVAGHYMQENGIESPPHDISIESFLQWLGGLK